MAFASLGDFLSTLEKTGELIRISDPIATELEISAAADLQMKKAGGGKALLFEKPTVNGKPSSFPLAINTLGSFRRMAMSMERDSLESIANELAFILKAKPPTSMREALRLLSTAFELRHAKPKMVKDGPCKE